MRAVAIACFVAATAGCSVGDVAPRARYPWVEHARVSLAEEKLVIAVDDDAVDVEAWFRFEGEGALPTTLDFPIGRGGDVERFAATLQGDDGSLTPLAIATASTPPVPVDDARETRSIFVPDRTIAHKNRLIVRYRQRRTPSFRYVLQSGAYWSGPIASLVVVVRDARGAIVSATVEDREADVRDGDERRWTFTDVEPHGGVALVLR